MKSSKNQAAEFQWPGRDAFLDLTGVEIFTDGHARCTAVALCDADRHPRRLFAQGQAAHIFFEFEILKPIAGPVFGGVELHTSTGFVAHGKSSFQFDPPVVTSVKRGQRVRFHHVMDLTLGPGEYTLGVGLASSSEEALATYVAGGLAYPALAPLLREHGRAVDATRFEIAFGPQGGLSHHGLADLPSATRVSTVGSLVKEPQATDAEALATGPTVFHVTHWKAGSQWINKILHECAPGRIVEPLVGEMQFLYKPILAGGVYPTVYVGKQQFDSVDLQRDSRRFVVIRDLRDTLVSAYFSVKVSHPLIENSHPVLRHALQSQSAESGLLFLMDEWLPPCARIQTSWLEAGERLIKYEDLLADDIGILEPILIDHCQLPVSREALRTIIEQSRFEQVTGGRPRGVEDTAAHERKGIAGDWRNHFTARVKEAFKVRYGGLLVATGYERDLDW